MANILGRLLTDAKIRFVYDFDNMKMAQRNDSVKTFKTNKTVPVMVRYLVNFKVSC